MRNILASLLALTMIFQMNAQSAAPTVLSSAGGSGQSGGNGVEWTLGELSVTTLTDGDQIMTQGFHQPQLIIVANEDLAVEIDFNVYPNPTQDRLILNNKGDVAFSFVIHDIKGALALSGDIPVGQTELDVSRLSSGHYQLSVLLDKSFIQSYSIEKIGL